MKKLLFILLVVSSCTAPKSTITVVVGRVKHTKTRTIIYPKNLITDKPIKSGYKYPYYDVRVNDTVKINRNWVIGPSFY
jgi:hypothetical protein